MYGGGGGGSDDDENSSDEAERSVREPLSPDSATEHLLNNNSKRSKIQKSGESENMYAFKYTAVLSAAQPSRNIV